MSNLLLALYRRTCDQCGRDFKRGFRMDLLINKISILSGDPHWDTQEDVEYLATFCSEECLSDFVAAQLGVNKNEVPG